MISSIILVLVKQNQIIYSFNAILKSNTKSVFEWIFAAEKEGNLTMREHQGEKWDGNSPEINHYLSLLHKPWCSTFKGPQIMKAENTKSIYYVSNECNSPNNGK